MYTPTRATRKRRFVHSTGAAIAPTSHRISLCLCTVRQQDGTGVLPTTWARVNDSEIEILSAIE